MKPSPLTKVDVTHRSLNDPGVIWLIANDYRVKVDNGRVFLVAP